MIMQACVCGKQPWPSKAKADQIVVNAKIANALYGNQKRREVRTYECPERRGVWHTTSRAEGEQRPRTPRLPEYEPDDDDAARDFLSRALFYGDTRPWERLYSEQYCAQTLRVLGYMHQSTLAEERTRNSRVATAAKRQKAGHITYEQLRRVEREREQWRETVGPMREALVGRLQQARAEMRRLNIAASKNKAVRENIHHRQMVRWLAMAVAEHRERTPEPTEADRALWAVLATHVIDGVTASGVPLAHYIEKGSWRRKVNEKPPRMPADL